MKLAVFSPYGNFSREAGLLYLVTNYLLKSGADVTQLRCDGAFSSCARDQKHNWNRTLFSCARCISEQRSLAQWAAVKSKDVSSFILADDVLQSTKWIASVHRSELVRSEFRGISLWEICRDDFSVRFQTADILRLSGSEEAHVRELFVSAVHALAAVDRFVSTVLPTIHLVVSSNDVLSNAYLAYLRSTRADAALFSYDSAEESIAIESATSGARYNTKLMLDDITAMRSEPKTWSPEVTSIVHEMLTFLGLAPDKVL
jgi:hypothetical protein